MRKKQLFESVLGFIFFAICIPASDAQVTEEWVRRYDGLISGSDVATDIAIDKQDNIYVTGTVGYSPDATTDIATISYSPLGTVRWMRFYNGTASLADMANAMTVDDIGNVYITGTTTGIGSGKDLITIKYSHLGVLQWARTYSVPGTWNEEGVAIEVDGLRNVYVTGTRGSKDNGTDYVTIKYNTSGVRQWVAGYDGPGHNNDLPKSLAVDQLGNVFVTGESVISTSPGGSPLNDYATVKYNSSGIQQWARGFGGSSEDRATDIALDNSGNIYVTGGSVRSESITDFATIKYNTSGTLLWTAYYNGPVNKNDKGISLEIDNISGSVYVTGWSEANPSSEDAVVAWDRDWATIKYNSSGVQQWVSRYSGPALNHDWPSSLVLDAAGNVYVTGFTYSEIAEGVQGYTTIKLSPAGTQLWQISYHGPAGDVDVANAIAVDRLGNVYVTGESIGIGTGSDFATIKYSQTGKSARGVMTKTTEKEPLLYFQVSSFPNPVSNSVRIQYEIPFDGRVAIRLYDIVGREVSVLMDEQKRAGRHSTDYNVSALQQGIYYYKVSLKGEEKAETRSGEMVVVK
jgi:Secretion system C-terminal sorting domain/Beta-propeller repeat